MPYKEKQVEKLYYSISEVAEMFSVRNSLIRFWEKEFDIIQPKKNKKGNR
ncbi:MAG: MerR family transcriptional regulator, partial [Bacteroidetes bacterium]|nr:MerR family transcriptional regulator [Bacteroidota bacterium]